MESTQKGILGIEKKEKKVRDKALDVDDFDELSELEHVLAAPAMYLSGLSKEIREDWIYNFETRKMELKSIDMPQALERTFLEIMSNAGDNAKRSYDSGLKMEEIGPIEVSFTDTSISIKNGGNPIPVKIKDGKGYVPQMIFGNLRSGSNFNKTFKKVVIGVNGIGAKLVNIFSKKFYVIVADNKNKKKYSQMWYNNMKEKTEALIEDYSGPNYVHITYELDLERFGYNTYNEEHISVFTRAALDTCFTNQIPLVLQGKLFPMYNLQEYKDLFRDDNTKKLFIYRYRDEKKHISMDILVTDTPDDALCISYVNGMITREGGAHVQSVYKSLSQYLIKKLQPPVIEVNKKEKRPNQLTMANIKPHLSVFVSCWAPDVEFNSQSKSLLVSPSINIEIPENILSKMNDWSVIERLRAEMDAKNFKLISKGDGKKSRHVKLTKDASVDANLAGTQRSKECTLYATEGNSAAGYILGLLDYTENALDRNGIFPFRGKLLNVMNAPVNQLAKNEEIKELKIMLGLKEGLDYGIESNFNTLRYGKFNIYSDSDVDGKHIIGLILNFFHCRFPSLLKRNFVFFGRTPILRAIKGIERIPFYTIGDFEKWKETLTDAQYKKYTKKYYKGLGSSEDEDLEQDHKINKIVTCEYDKKAPESMRVAFDQSLSDERKKWMKNASLIADISDIKIMPISRFINEEFAQFSLENTRRSIPFYLDGLKEGQRKILYTVLNYWGWTVSSQNKANEMKVSQLGSLTALQTGYHHGEMNLSGTIEGMVQRFMGTNNMPYLCSKGRFGTRSAGGKDKAQTRYTFTRPEFWIPYVFRSEDAPLLVPQEEEGLKIEPKFLLPIIPMTLVNGSSGVGSGFSTFIPNYNPLDITLWLIKRIKGEPLPTLIPWYRNFTGKISLKEKKKIKKSKCLEIKSEKEIEKENKLENEIENGKEEEEEDKFDHALEEEEEIENKKESTTEKKKEYEMKWSMISEGVFEWKNDGTVHIIELPLGCWTIPYYNKVLMKMITDKKISDVRMRSTTEKVHFEVIGVTQEPTSKMFSLQRSFGMGNMVLLDESNLPKKYENVNEIIELFYKNRLPFFEKRRLYLLNECEIEIKKKKEKIRFIHSVQKGEFTFIGEDEEFVLKQLREKNISEEYLSKINLKNVTKTDTIKEEKELEEIQNKINYYQTITGDKLWLQNLEEFEIIYRKYYK